MKRLIKWIGIGFGILVLLGVIGSLISDSEPVVEETITTTTEVVPETTAATIADIEVRRMAFEVRMEEILDTTYQEEMEDIAVALCDLFDSLDSSDVEVWAETMAVAVYLLDESGLFSVEQNLGIVGTSVAAFCPEHQDMVLEAGEFIDENWK